MSIITDWIKTELYPALYQSIDIALPEFDFKIVGRKWISSNKTKITGEQGDSIGKVYVYENSPAFIKDYTRDSLSIVDYVIRRDGVDFIKAVKTLSDVVGLQIPKGDFDNENYIKDKQKNQILEDCNSYFIDCLETSTDAEEVKAYLSSRAYNLEDVRAMELGYIPDQNNLINHLLSKGYNQTLIGDTVKLNKGIGSTHILTIPYRSGGSIKGFIVRAIKDVAPAPKYLVSTGLIRDGFFNLSPIKGDKDLLIVEGYLDALISQSKGVDNVVALGGAQITKEQIKDAIKRGAKSFTLCLDTDKAGKEGVNRAIDVILGEGVNRIYIVTLPDLGGSKTDPDSLIKESGEEAFKEAIKGAIPYYEYKLIDTITKYGKIEEESGELQPRDIDSLLEEIVTTASKLDPIDRDRYKKTFISLDAIKGLGISEESLSITVDRLTSTRDKEAQAKDFKKLLSEATQLQDKGETDKALELLDSKVKEVKLKDKATEFSSLMKPIKEDELKERQANKPESLNSGFTIGGEPLLLPSGAISIFAAPTSHGKTTFLINLALNVAKLDPNKQTYLFSYEEDSDSILINALNTYMDEEISGNNRTTLKNYFSGKNKKTPPLKKEQFFKELIENNRLNIHYSNYNSDTLTEAIRYLYKYAKPGAIFIDYIQLLNLPQGKYKTYSRQEEIKEICIALKDVAVETGLPIILGAQFNREVVNQLRLHATKIGEAGDIERIANLIVGFWNNKFKPLATEGELNEINARGLYSPNSIYTTILKNRGGVVGLDEVLSFNGNTGKIKNREVVDTAPTYFK